MKLIRILWNNDSGESSGAHGVFEGTADTGEGAPPAETQGGEAEPPAETPPPAQPTATLTPEQIAQIAAGVVQQAIPPQQQQQKELSPEEFDKTFHMARVKADSYAKLRALISQDTPEAHAEGAQLLEGLLQAAARQAIVMGGFQQADLEDRIMQRVAPLMNLVQQQQIETLKTEFYSANKDLQPWATVVEAVTQKLQAAGAFKSLNGDKAKTFKLVADEARKVIQGLPGGGQGGQPSTGQQPQSRTSRMSTLTSGGQGGTQRGAPSTDGMTKRQKESHAVFSSK